MAAQNIDGILSALPPHPHRRLHILLSILAFMIVVWSVTFYQLNKVKEEVLPEIQDSGGISKELRDKAIAELEVRMQTNPPVSQAQRDKALQDLKKRMGN